MLHLVGQTSNATEDMHLDATDELCPGTLADLISCIEIAAYSLMRSGERSAAMQMLYSVSDLEKIKSRKSDHLIAS